GFALSQPLLPSPGYDFQYTNVTTSLAAGAVEYSSGMTMLDLANQTLFGPMGFKNQEGMEEGPTGIDNGATGLRLRPVDMEKFGVLYLDHGCWQGKQLIPRDWVDLSFQPWIRSEPGLEKPNYGWYWWRSFWGNGWTGHVANGRTGQRIAVFPAQKVVVTMTAIIENKDREEQIWGKVVRYVTQLLNDPQLTDPTSKDAKSRLEASSLSENPPHSD